jgi:DNA-binding MarR family transcriptional regulator
MGHNVDVAFGTANLFAASTAVGNMVESRVLRPHGLTLAGWRLLLTLRLGGPNEPRNLSRILFLTRPSIVNGLNTLQRAGLIRRTPSKDDRRLVVASITPEGEALFDVVAPQWFATLEEVTSELDAHQTATLSLLAGHVAVVAERMEMSDRRSRPFPPGPFEVDQEEG